jgi:Na+-driven multidrug efflux pump
MARFVGEFFPPDVSAPFLQKVLVGTWETLAMSALGTLLAAIVGLALALPASRLHEGDAAWGRAPTRLLLNALRSVPELVWAALLPIVSMWGFQFDGVFIGATRTRELLVTMAVAAAAFWGLSVMLQPLWGNHGLWVSMLGFMALRGLMLGVLLPRVWWAA